MPTGSPFHDSDWPTKLGAKTPFFRMTQYRHTQALNYSKFRAKVKHIFSRVNQNAKINMYMCTLDGSEFGWDKTPFFINDSIQTHTDTRLADTSHGHAHGLTGMPTGSRQPIKSGSRQPIRFLIICHSRLWLDHGITTANQIRNNVPFHDSDWPTKLGAKTPFFINDSIQAHTGTRLADTSPRACPRAHDSQSDS